MDTYGTTIVAIPAVDDYVWRISSQTVPHITLLYLGENVSEEKQKMIAEFLEHAAEMSIHKFSLEVDRRDVLGDKEADVLYLDGGYSLNELKRLRHALLQNNTISTEYNSIEQFPEWIPHLTLGYPDEPAHEDTREYPGLHWVGFDRLALWTHDYEGPEFRLKDRFEYADVAMSDISRGEAATNEMFQSGVKGMRWGVRKDRSPVDATVAQPRAGGRVVAKGGQNQPASEDAKKAASTAQKAKASTVDSLSNQELQDLVRRMNLEAQYTQLSANRQSAGAKFLKKLFSDAGKKQATSVFNEQADAYGQQVNRALSDRLTKDKP